MKIIIRQVLGILMFISNHVCFLLIRETPIYQLLKVTSTLMGTVIVVLCFCDYQFNYKKYRQFKISPSY